YALGAIAALGGEGKPALSVVLDFAVKEGQRNRSGMAGSHHAVDIIRALMAIAPEDKQVFTVLRSCVGSAGIFASKLEAAKALPRTPFRKETVKVLIESLRTDNNAAMKVAVAQALGEIGPDAKDAVQYLETATIDNSAAVRAAASAALRKIK